MKFHIPPARAEQLTINLVTTEGCEPGGGSHSFIPPGMRHNSVLYCWCGEHRIYAQPSDVDGGWDVELLSSS